MRRYWDHLVRSTEKRVEDFLERQIRDRGREDFGRMESQVIEGKETIYQLTNALCVYFCQESGYYKDAGLWTAILDGVGFVERWQRPDGSLDYPICNFYSAPDTAFCFRRLYGAWEVLRRYGSTEKEKELQERYLILLLRCIPILLYGGFHTPNHRWAVLAALLCEEKLVRENPELALETADFAACSYASPASFSDGEELCVRLRERAGQYLAEGIDGDEDGGYAERSTGNYNAVVDKSLMLAYEMTGDEDFLGYVERNLEMMLYYFDGDDTIFTQNSTRQDQGKAVYGDPYFYLYTYMAARTGSSRLDGAAHKFIADNRKRGDLAPDCLYIFMTHEELRRYEFRGYGFPETYRKYFPASQVLRVRKPGYVYTVLNHRAGFLFLKFGSLPLALRIGEAYCDVRNFVPQRMETEEGGCTLTAETEGWYYQPLKEPQGTSDWWRMDHSKRERLVTSRLRITVRIRELENGLSVTVKSEGLDGLPLRVELEIPAGGVLENETVRLTAGKGESLILKSGELKLRYGNQKLKVGPGYGTHSFQGHYSGEKKNEAGYSVFLNDYTPYERTFSILEDPILSILEE